MPARVLIYAEDPGAALFLRDLPAALVGRGIEVVVMASELAARYFDGMDLLSPPARAEATPALAAATLRQVGADRIVVGTSEDPESFAFELVDAARSAGIASFGAVDSPANAEERFQGRTSDPLAHVPDALLVPDRTTEAAYLRLGMSPARVVRCGHTQLHAIALLRAQWGDTERRAHRHRWFGEVAAGRPILVFVSELSTGLVDGLYQRSPDYRLQGTSGADGRTDIVAEEFLLAARALPSNPHLVLRLHPKQRREDERRLIELFDQVSQDEPALEICHAADLVVGMTSILLAEAATLGRPVLSIVPRPAERAWLGDLAEDLACVWERADIAGQLANWPKVVGAGAAAERSPAAIMAERILEDVKGGGHAGV